LLDDGDVEGTVLEGGDLGFEVADACEEFFAFAFGFLGAACGFAGDEGGAVFFEELGEVWSVGFLEDGDAVAEGLIDLGEVVAAVGEELVEGFAGALDVGFLVTGFLLHDLGSETAGFFGGASGVFFEGGGAEGGGFGWVELEARLEGLGEVFEGDLADAGGVFEAEPVGFGAEEGDFEERAAVVEADVAEFFGRGREGRGGEGEGQQEEGCGERGEIHGGSGKSEDGRIDAREKDLFNGDAGEWTDGGEGEFCARGGGGWRFAGKESTIR
jgi:hypothetical protein